MIIKLQLDGDNQSITVASRQFTFDRVFGFESTQMDVYTLAPKQIVEFVLQGYNGKYSVHVIHVTMLVLAHSFIGTIFAYGQTGTGKTHTASGILSHCFAHIFGFIAKSAKNSQFLVRASYYEIYNEEIRDLLVSFNWPN